MAFLSIDVGSSLVKAALIAEDGSLLALARRPVTMRHGPGSNEHESDPNEWVAAAFEAIREISAGGVAPRAFVVSGNGPTLVALDGADRPVGPALTWMDRRASTEAALVSHHAGIPVDASFYLPKALWFARKHPEAGRIRRFLACPEQLLQVMTGEAWTLLPAPGYLPYIWSPELIDAVGLDRGLFPPFIAPARPCGELRAELAAELGLPPGLPAFAGFPDFLAGLVGAGIVEEGMAGDRGGTSEALNIAARSPFPGRGLLSLPHAIDGLWNLSGGLSTAGKSLEWLAANLGYRDSAELVEVAASAAPGSGGLVFIPYLAGERAPLWDADRRGAFAGISLSTGRREMARASCEALCYALRLPAELARDAGYALREVRATGGTARSPFLASLKASILRVPVAIPEVGDCELVGDAAAAAVGLGDHADLASATRTMSRIASRSEPDLELAGRYDEAYGLWKEALGALAHVDAHAASLSFAKRDDE
ncbi:MAG TPA: FGGY-family carbohydrate kinase [Rectinemataceae bacterium]|nr:FGGY-family carbohydrate kinase [Rectinemataceae bacterium]